MQKPYRKRKHMAYVSITCVAQLVAKWAMNTQVTLVTGYSPYKMVFHCEQRMFKSKSNDGPKESQKSKSMSKIPNGLEKGENIQMKRHLQ